MKTVMHRYLAWLRKEWRDQRAILLGIAVAIPGLTALAYGAFGENLLTARLESVQTVFLAIAVGMVVFAVAGDLFAGENRRGTIHAMRRLPGGMGAGFAAKLTLLTLAILLAITLQGLSLAVAEHALRDVIRQLGVTNAGGAVALDRPAELLDGLAAFPTSAFWLTGLVFGVVGLWTLLVSSWMGRSGVAGLGAAVLLVAIAAPFFLLFKEHPWYVPGPKRLALAGAGVGSVVALVALSFSFLRGQRFAGRPLRPVLLGLAVLGVAVGGGYAYARQDIQRWITFGPHAEDLAIHHASIGADGRHLYLTVSRGAWWQDGRILTDGPETSDPWRSRRGTPSQAWVVDLGDGSWRPIDDRAQRYLMPVPECDTVAARVGLDPVEALACYRFDAGQEPTIGWLDARTGTDGRVLPFRVRDAAALDLVRRQLRADSWVRDARGRRVWLRDDVIERDGETFERPAAPIARVVTDRELVWMRPVPGGWFGYAKGERGYAPVVLDATTGVRTAVPWPDGVGRVGQPNVLSTSHVLVSETLPADGRVPGGPTSRRRVMAIADPEHRVEPRNEPPMVGTVVAKDLVLALRGAEDARTLHLWNPLTGADRPLRWQGAAPEAIRAAHVHGRTGDGRVLLQVWRSREGGPGEHGYAVIDADLATVRLVLPLRWRHTGLSGRKGRGLEVIALMPDDSLVLLDEGRRVVRVQPGGKTELLFPTG